MNKIKLFHIILISFMLSLCLNLILVSNLSLFKWDINSFELSTTKIILMGLSIIWETSFFSAIFFILSKKIFKN
jgi:hypothetical protein